MTAMNLRLPTSLHRIAREIAKEEGVSMNQFVATALAEKVSALSTESYLKERAARASKDKFLAAMAKVADVEPQNKQDQIEL